MPRPIAATSVEPASGNTYPEPFHSRMGDANWRALGDAFGLTQFGFSLEELQPGAQSALRHWHTLEDEFVYVLEGELVLHTDAGATRMGAGDCVGFKAGDPDAHHLVNEGRVVARMIVVGSRRAGDNCFYPDDDLAFFPEEEGARLVHKDGTPYPD